MMAFGRDGLLYHNIADQLLAFDPKTGRVLDLGRMVNADAADHKLALHGGGSVGPDGTIYAFATTPKRGVHAVVALSPADVDKSAARLLRVSPQTVLYPPASQPEHVAGPDSKD